MFAILHSAEDRLRVARSHPTDEQGKPVVGCIQVAAPNHSLLLARYWLTIDQTSALSSSVSAIRPHRVGGERIRQNDLGQNDLGRNALSFRSKHQCQDFWSKLTRTPPKQLWKGVRHISERLFILCWS